MITLQFAAPSDAPALLAVYAPYIDTPVTFEYTVPTVSAFAQRVTDVMKAYPYLVAARDGQIVGYAYAHHYRERAAYQWDAELSVYVDKNAARQGIGRKLYAALFELLAMQGVVNAYACVTLPNPGSEALHAHMGFQSLGTFPHVGYKDGAWHDVRWYGRTLLPLTQPPKPIQPFPALKRDMVERVLERINHAGQETVRSSAPGDADEVYYPDGTIKHECW